MKRIWNFILDKECVVVEEHLYRKEKEYRRRKLLNPSQYKRLSRNRRSPIIEDPSESLLHSDFVFFPAEIVKNFKKFDES